MLGVGLWVYYIVSNYLLMYFVVIMTHDVCHNLSIWSRIESLHLLKHFFEATAHVVEGVFKV